jgi:hypothetical protein
MASIIVLIACALLLTPIGSDDHTTVSSSPTSASIEQIAAAPSATDTSPSAASPHVAETSSKSLLTRSSIDVGEWSNASDSDAAHLFLSESLPDWLGESPDDEQSLLASLPLCLDCGLTPPSLAHLGSFQDTGIDSADSISGGSGFLSGLFGGRGYSRSGFSGGGGFGGGGTGGGGIGRGTGLDSTAGLIELGGPTGSGGNHGDSGRHGGNGNGNGNGNGRGYGYGPTDDIYLPPVTPNNPGSNSTTPVSVPEPSTMLLTGIGAISLMIRSRIALKRQG